MALTDLFRRRPRTSTRYLRALVGELAGIRQALERTNQLWAASDPAIEHALEVAEDGKAPAEQASSVTYVDQFVIRMVEQEQARIFQTTGMLQDQDVIYERLVQEGRIES